MRHSITKRWVSNVTPEEKKLLIQEIPRYIKENCYYTDGSIKYAIRSASERLRDHYDLAMLAITTYTDAYIYLSPRLQNHPEIMTLYSFKKEEENKWLPSKTR